MSGNRTSNNMDRVRSAFVTMAHFVFSVNGTSSMLRHLVIIQLCLLTSMAPALAQGKLPKFLSNEFSFGKTDQQAEKIQVTAELVPVDASSVDLNVTVTLPHDHHIYSATTPFGIPTKISITEAPGLELQGNMRADRAPKIVRDGTDVMEEFEDKVTWSQRLRAKSGSLPSGLRVSGELTGQYCGNGEGGSCMLISPPEKFTATLAEGVAIPASAAAPIDSGKSNSVTVVPSLRLPTGLTQPPIRYTISLNPETPVPGDDITLTIRATIDQPYHTYSMTQDPDVLGTTPTEIILESVIGAEPIGAIKCMMKPEVKPGLQKNEVIEIHHDSVEWVQRLTATEDVVSVTGQIVFQVCDPRQCLEVTEVSFAVSAGESGQSAAAVAGIDGTHTNRSGSESDFETADSFGQSSASTGLIPFILSAISAGFLALLTPCVFPMIPVTVASFLKQGQDRPGSTLKLAIIYCVGIVGAFTVLGLLMAVVVGPTALNQLANNPWLNLAFSVIFTVFALMLMGMFEIQIPSWLLTWSAKNQESCGVMGVMFMALTFTLVSFTCTFAFVGSILVWAAQGDYFRPIIGMVAFSSAFASPFFLLALFPGFLKKLPKSGGWMNSVKVTLGLVELAIVTKFLSVADTGFSSTGTPQYLDFHLVLASWIAIALITGMYLLGRFRLPHDSPSDTVGPLRCMFALGFFGLAAYIATGVFSPKAPEGVLWQQIVAFAPPQISYSNTGDDFFIEHDGLQYALDFDKAVKTASSSNMPMFLDFTGVNCINCRRMEKGVLATEAVHGVLKDLVRVQLYVDEVPGVKTNPEEHDRLLTRNRDLQQDWVGDVTIPAYVIATPDGNEILATFKGLDTTGEEFQQFLKAGLKRWKQRQSAATQQGTPFQSASYNNH